MVTSWNPIAFMVLVTGVRCIPNTYSDWRTDFDCFKEVIRYLKLRDIHVMKFLSVNSLDHCKKECDMSFRNCQSFSYNHDPDDLLEANCLISSKSELDLDTRVSSSIYNRDFELDDDFVYYGRVPSSQCTSSSFLYSSSRIGFPSSSSSFRFPSSSNYNGRESGRGRGTCYKLVKTSRRIADVRKKIRTLSIAECEDECSSASFTCRGFNYRFRAYSSSRYMENCELSSRDTYGVDIDDKFVFSRDDDYDFYERTGFGRECDGSGFRNREGYPGNNNYNSADCFTLYEKNKRLDARMIRDKMKAKSLKDCKDQCIWARNFDCRSLSYSPKNGPRDQFTDTESKSYPTSFGSSAWYSQDGECYLSDVEPRRMSSYDLIFDSAFDVYGKEDQYNCRNGGGDPNSGLHGRESRFTTVSGMSCIDSRGCQEYRMETFYRCDTNLNGGWDYCCRPDSRCEVMRGSNIIGCYVGIGSNLDQWRPCTNITSVYPRNSRARGYLMESGAPDGKPSGVNLVAEGKEDKTASKPLQAIDVENIPDLKN